jgi:hypothetical protein
MTSAVLHGIPWTDLPYHPVPRAGVILGISNSHVYKLLHEGRLRAVRSVGKTQITTTSMVELQSDAKAGTPDASRVARANKIRLKRNTNAACK